MCVGVRALWTQRNDHVTVLLTIYATESSSKEETPVRETEDGKKVKKNYEREMEFFKKRKETRE